VGRRSRKRGGAGDPAEPLSATASTRAERDAARRERAAAARAGKAAPATPGRRSARPGVDERPPPLWGSFPLTEILTFAGIVLMVWGFLGGGGAEANAKLAAGLVIASLGGLELAIREHVTGFRSHTSLLAGIIGIATIIAFGLISGVDILGPLLISGVLSFAAAFYGLRALFKRRSGGASFR
jgi:hypothetical protein